MLAQEGVLECAAVPVPDPVIGERVCLFVTICDSVADEVTLRAYAAENLSDYKQPDYYKISTDALPRNANGNGNGKVVKSQLVRVANEIEKLRK